MVYRTSFFYFIYIYIFIIITYVQFYAKIQFFPLDLLYERDRKKKEIIYIMCIHGIGQLTVLIHGRGNESKEDLRIRYMKSRNKRIEFILHGELKVRIKSSQYFRKPAPGNRID